VAEVFRVVEVEQLAITTAVVYTTPSNTTALVTFCVAVNESSSNSSFTVTVTPSGGSAATYIPDKAIPAGHSNLMPEILGLGLDAGDVINAFAADASAVNLKLRILEST
jgi:hypothetical protein